MKRNTLFIILAAVGLALWYFVFRKGAATRDPATGQNRVNIPGVGAVTVPKILDKYITPDVANNVNRGVAAGGGGGKGLDVGGLVNAATGLIKATGLDTAVKGWFTRDPVAQPAYNPRGYVADWGSTLGDSSAGLNVNTWSPVTPYSTGGSFWGVDAKSEPSNYVMMSSGNTSEDFYDADTGFDWTWGN